jgi:hypothetical protein
MRLPSLLLLLPVFGLLSPAPAAGLSIRDLNLPMFDATGQRTQTLTAATAEGPLDRLVLKAGVITFHATLGETVAPGSTLRFDEAVYDKTGGFVEGAGPVRFSSAGGDLSGVGFHYEVATGRLKLRREVLLELKDKPFEGVKIRGETADTVVRQNPTDRSWTLGDALITGPVVATGVTIGTTRFDRAETDRVTYSAANGIVTLAAPVTAWNNGEKIILSQSFQYQLEPAPAGKAPAPALPPASDGAR